MTLKGALQFLTSRLESCGVIYLFLTSCLAAVAAYYAMFSWVVSFWDDEGTMIWRVKQYSAGFKLYDQIYSSYGPVYYLYNGLIHSISGVEVTYDSTRMIALVSWVVCALFAALILFWFTQSLSLAAVAQFLIFGNLSFFGNEPGHPEELCMFLLLALMASGFLVKRPAWRMIAMILIGVIAAAISMTKVNLGIFAILAIGFAILFQLPSTVFSRASRIAAVAAALILPVTLMKSHLDHLWTQVFCFEVTASIATLLPGLIYTSRSSSVRRQDCWAVILSFMATIGLIWLATLTKGVSSYGMFNSLVMANFQANVLSRSWYAPLEMSPLWVPWAVGGMVAALWFNRAIKRDPRKAYLLLCRFKLIFGSLVLFLATVRTTNPGYTVTVLTLMPGFVPPFCWLLLYPPSPDSKPSGFPRILLSATAIFQTLVAHPIGGSQAFFTRILLILVGALLVGDFFAAPESSSTKSSIELRPAMQAAALTILLMLPLKYVMLANQDRQTYKSRPPLTLAGAKRIHLPETQTRAYQWLAQNIRENCDLLMGLPGFLSLNLWSGAAAPAWASAGGDWMDGLNSQQQSEMVSTLSMHANACIVYSPRLVAVTPGPPDLDTLPLARYMFENFKPAGSVNIALTSSEVTGLRRVRYYLMVRKDRDLVFAPPLPQQARAFANMNSSGLISRTNGENR
jgi:hypothetical protein